MGLESPKTGEPDNGPEIPNTTPKIPKTVQKPLRKPENHPENRPQNRRSAPKTQKSPKKRPVTPKTALLLFSIFGGKLLGSCDTWLCEVMYSKIIVKKPIILPMCKKERKTYL